MCTRSRSRYTDSKGYWSSPASRGGAELTKGYCFSRHKAYEPSPNSPTPASPTTSSGFTRGAAPNQTTPRASRRVTSPASPAVPSVPSGPQRSPAVPPAAPSISARACQFGSATERHDHGRVEHVIADWPACALAGPARNSKWRGSFKLLTAIMKISAHMQRSA